MLTKRYAAAIRIHAASTGGRVRRSRRPAGRRVYAIVCMEQSRRVSKFDGIEHASHIACAAEPSSSNWPRMAAASQQCRMSFQLVEELSP